MNHIYRMAIIGTATSMLALSVHSKPAFEKAAHKYVAKHHVHVAIAPNKNSCYETVHAMREHVNEIYHAHPTTKGKEVAWWAKIETDKAEHACVAKFGSRKNKKSLKKYLDLVTGTAIVTFPTTIAGTALSVEYCERNLETCLRAIQKGMKSRR